MISRIRLRNHDEATLSSVASTLTTVAGVRDARPEPPSRIRVDWDDDVLDEGELLTVIGMDGLEVSDVQTIEEDDRSHR